MIRQETEQDFEQVNQLIKKAFENVEHSDGKEHLLVAELRKSDAFIPKLSLVAEEEGRIVGHILLTEGKVGDETVLMLAPLSVRREYQNQGIGSLLVQEGHKKAQLLGYSYILVLGSDLFYPRFGYLPAQKFGIEIPADFPSKNFMAIKLQEDAPKVGGKVVYAKEFGIHE